MCNAFKDDNMKLMINDKEDDVIEKNFQSLLSRYQIRLETSMKGSGFIFGCLNLLQYKCHRKNLNMADHVEIPLLR